MNEILQKENLILKKQAKKIKLEEINSKKIKLLVSKMNKILEKTENGVALSAPQIGESLQVFVVSDKVFNNSEQQDKNLVFINPEIIKKSKKTQNMEEGCLSVEGVYGIVPRSVKTKVRAYDEDGKIFEYGGSNILSQIFQHEIDHLNGILFTEKAIKLYELNKNE